jgi:hypothetical protein
MEHPTNLPRFASQCLPLRMVILADLSLSRGQAATFSLKYVPPFTMASTAFNKH